MAYARGSSSWRARYWGAACKPTLVDVAIGPNVKRGVDKRARDAFVALALVLAAFDYHVRSKDSGVYNCRKITGGTSMSSHSWATSLDLNWLTNPYRLDRLVTDMGLDMIEAIQQIKTKGGVHVFRWGGDWDGRPNTTHSNYDAMHFEVIATPAELAKGINWKSVRQAKLDVRKPRTWPVLERGDFGPTVQRLQRELNDSAGRKVLEVDGDFGDKTLDWVRSYQRSRKIKVDGEVGLSTWTALFTDQPPAGRDTPSPVKLPVPALPVLTPVETNRARRARLARQLERATKAAVEELT